MKAICASVNLLAFMELSLNPDRDHSGKFQFQMAGFSGCTSNSLFAGSDGGGRTSATIATLLQTAKMNDVDPLA